MSAWMLIAPFVVGFLSFFVGNAVKNTKGGRSPVFGKAWADLVRKLGGGRQAADAINDVLKNGYVSKPEIKLDGPKIIAGITPALHNHYVGAITGINPCAEVPLTKAEPCNLPAFTYLGKIVRILQ